MPHPPVRAPRAFSAGRALLLAGLFCLQSSGLLAELPPARSAAPVATPEPEVSKADLESLRLESQDALKASRQQLDELQTQLKTQLQGIRSNEALLAGQQATLGSLEKRLSGLAESAALRDGEAAAQGQRFKALNDDMAALKLDAEGGAKKMREGLADIERLRTELKERQSKLDSLTDLLSVIKKDVDASSEEIVEVKQALKLYEKPVAAKTESLGGEWWDQILGWKYLPAVATGLGLAAIGVAVSK